jgi:hypothetical protein
MSWDNVVNMGEVAWKVIEDGKPVAGIEHKTFNAVPQVDDWNSITGATGPNSVGYRWKMTNGFGIDVVVVEYAIKWEYGARYRDGGAFIPNVWLSVPVCDVKWGFSIDLSVHAHNPTNAGSATAPKARLPLTLSASVDTPFWTDNKQWDFVLFGDGTYEK